MGIKDGIIFDIKKYAIHDGPGIRTTVFLKGCPLQCFWCHNPEGIDSDPELIYQENRCLEDCSDCINVCPNEALAQQNESIVIDRKKCALSGKCTDICPTEALRIIGRKISVVELIREIEKDRVFFEQSNGGVTFSGGEPLMQPEFLFALLEECHKRNIHTAVDTCGYTPFKNFAEIKDKVDLFLFDLKIMDEKKHKDITGTSNRLILENLKNLSELKKKINIRIPLIANLNDTEKNTIQTAEFLKSLGNIKDINLLPYHKIGTGKYKNLKRKAYGPDIKTPLAEKINKIKIWFANYGFNVKIGG